MTKAKESFYFFLGISLSLFMVFGMRKYYKNIKCAYNVVVIIIFSAVCVEFKLIN